MPIEIIQFDEFELDLGRYQLRRGGRVVKLEKNPMELLILLVEKRGLLVTREEVIQRLWGDNVFVDTRHGVNTAVHKLRRALRDDSEQPRILETVVGRGYRLVAAIEVTPYSTLTNHDGGKGKADGNGAGEKSMVKSFLEPPAAARSTELIGTIAQPSQAPVQPRSDEDISEDKRAASGGTTMPRWSRRLLLIGATAVVFVVTLIAVGAFYFANDNRTRINSVAVLPFANASGDPSMEYLSDGITEGVIDNLSGLPNIKVISRTSSFHYKQREIEPQKAARELGVDALVTGRVVQRGYDLTVSAELVDAREDKQLWGEQYRRKTADIGSVQREIATAISGSLRVRLTAKDKNRLAKLSATNPEAYQLYLKGRYHANQTTASELNKSIDYFRQAIEKDPSYAPAYAGMADSYSEIGGGWMYLSPTDSIPKAKAAAMKALELDDTLAEAHAALAYAEFFDWDWQSAEREFKRAIELNPNSALSHARYAECLVARLRFNESVAQAQEAQELDPLSPAIVSGLGSIQFMTRQYDDSIAELQKALDLNPNIPVLRAMLGSSYAMKHMYSQALAEYDKIPDQDKAVAPENQFVAGTLGWLYAISGRRSDALKIAQRFKELSAQAYVDFYWPAVIYAGLGDKDETFRLLEKGYLEHSASLPYFAVEPFWYGWHSDPRYADLLSRVGLPQPE